MPHRARPARPHPSEAPQAAPTESRYRVTRYGKTRNFAAYEGQNIIAVTLYRRGAEEITARLDEKDRRITELERHLAAAAQIVPLLLSPAAEPVQSPESHPSPPLPRLAAEDARPDRTAPPRRRPVPAPRPS